jgi:hypothetical protein
MKKALAAILMTLAVMGIVSQPALFVKTAEAFSNRAMLAARLPSNVTIPNTLPHSIQDPLLLEAWVRLYNHQEPMQLWDGSHITGRQLAIFALEHNLPIVWDTDLVCGGGSCSVRYCDRGVCTFDDPQHPGIRPIHLAPVDQGDPNFMQFLVGTLAHEIFHRTAPFGTAPDTKFEEYWAFRIGAAIGKNAAPNFDGIDPLRSGNLFIWLLKNHLTFYYLLPEYPASVAALVEAH